MIAWGTTYYIPAVLKSRFASDLGLTDASIFAGVALTLIVAALLAWPAGQWMERAGAGRLMPLGSAVLALGLIVLSLASGLWSYLASWAIFGIGMALCMSNAAFSALTQMAGQRARRSIVIVMLFGGLASTLFWPLTLGLESALGWRNTCLIYAALHLVVCLPLHRVFLARGTQAAYRVDMKGDASTGKIAPHRRRLAAGLIGLAMASSGFVSWGLDLHLISIITDFGLPTALAVTLAAMKGPAVLLARGVDLGVAKRITPLQSALVAGLMIPFSLAMAIAFGSGLGGAVLFVVLHGFGTGLMTVARATLPLALLGAEGYASTLGRMTLPTQCVYALSPLSFSLLIDRFGVAASLQIAMLASLICLVCLIVLSRLSRA